MSGLLYIDSSSLLSLVLEQEGWRTVAERLDAAHADDRNVVSSRVLWLEARRIAVRERLRGYDLTHRIEAALGRVQQLPVTEDTWGLAAGIEQHVKSLDALHLATCELVDATLLTARLDGGIRSVAEARGIPLA